MTSSHSEGNTATMLTITPLVEVAVGRRPYTAERDGQLILKVAGPPLLPLGSVVTVKDALLPPDVYSQSLVSGAAAKGGNVNLVSFPLDLLPTMVLADLVITVAIPNYGTVEYTKNFQRAPPPTNPNITVVVVDHLTRGMLMGRSTNNVPVAPWLPFLAVGWFNTAFTYPAEGSGDSSWAPPPAEVSPALVAGSNRYAQWARKGVNLVRVGGNLQPELMLAHLDHMHASGIHAIVSVPTPGHCNDTAKAGEPPRNCTADYENMVSNMTLVRAHPATWGYYICDDCCAGFNYLVELAVVYKMMKEIDPYHLTAGALECGEMHAFQEPHLSLDVPMRENYRPDLGFHGNDGRSLGGSDGLLRMPPMTFEPLMNMPDAVRQPIGKRAQTAAWLGVVTADMPHLNWYVYNHIMYARWALEDATSAVNAQLLELTPSLLGPVTIVQPKTTVLAEAAGWARARAWRDSGFESAAPGNLCVHVVVASINDVPATFTLEIDGLCLGSSGSGDNRTINTTTGAIGGGTNRCPSTLAAAASGEAGGTSVLNATHLFNEDYAVPVVPSAAGAATHTITDVLMPGSTAIYAIGCDSWTTDATNLVNDPGFEASDRQCAPVRLAE